MFISLHRLEAQAPLIRFTALAIFTWAFLQTNLVLGSSHFEIRDAMQRDVIQLVSDTPLEKITGLSSAVIGFVDLDTKNLKANFEMDLRQLDTTSATKNDFLSRLLQLSENPFAKLFIEKIPLPQKMKDSEPTTVRGSATLDFHGIKKPVPVLLTFTSLKASDQTAQRALGNLVRISLKAEISAADFSIDAAATARARLAKTWQLFIDAVGTDAPVPTLK